MGARLRSLGLDGGPRRVKHCGSEKRIWKLGVGAAHNIHDCLQREEFSACGGTGLEVTHEATERG